MYVLLQLGFWSGIVYISYDENEGKEREIVIENEVLCKHSRHNITPKNQL